MRATALVTLAVSAVAVVSLQTPASAQTACPNPGGNYPPSSCEGPAAGQGQGLSDDRVVAGQEITVNSGAGRFTPGSTVSYGVDGRVLGTTVANAQGAAIFSFRVPSDLRPGRYDVVLTGTLSGAAATVRLPFTVVPATAAQPRTGALGALPRTGAEQAVPMAATGIALVVAGAGVVLVARRRSSELDAR